MKGPFPDVLLANLERLGLDYAWGLSGPLPSGLRLPGLEELDIFLTQACAPAAWRDWLATIDFTGRLCGTGMGDMIDVAVVYTPARDAAGGTAAIGAVIDLMVAETNEALAASDVRHRVVLVERSEVEGKSYELTATASSAVQADTTVELKRGAAASNAGEDD